MRLGRPFLIFVLLLVAAFGIVRGAAQTADALHTHVVCVEHGDLVHMSAGASYSSRSELRALASDHHDGCALAAFATPPSSPLPAPPFARLDAPAPLTADARAPPSATASTSVPLLSNAPKTSPPV